ncbi:MAG TPA: heparan-alpha-glucosaminide N-acetyltransferase domain-containing protein [Polyangiaceae bacterium]|jgi:uncharacterized membrane protein|nr:heparan-alpha-glucosaminide N-acetyltransferase domain-containing protein [Polyangiaceae bacterium]
MSDAAPPTRLSGAAGHRSPALDWMRGLVMVLMALDHSSEELNAGRLFTDATFAYQPGMPLPVAQFLTRWVTHLCAPTFVFLTGTGLALSIGRRVAAGEAAWRLDRYLLLRGLIVAGCELWVSWFWMPPGRFLLQVLYAIGTSYVLMVPLRRLPARVLVGLAVAEIALGEALTLRFGWGPPETTPLAASLLFVPGRHGPLFIAYPALPWLAIMLLGWAFGGFLATKPSPRVLGLRLALSGLALLALFAVVRGCNGYGNMGLLRDGAGPVQWLHVSKYPPSLTYVSLELGCMALLLAVFTGVAQHRTARPHGVLLVLGRTPMFFYLLHIPVLSLSARWFGVNHALGLGGTYAAAVGVVALLYPFCRVYGRYKAAHPSGWPRYV